MQSKVHVLHISLQQYFLQLVSNTPYITKRTSPLALQTAEELKKEGTETEKKEILEENNKIKAENICPNS